MPDEPQKRKKSKWKWMLLLFVLCGFLMVVAITFPIWGLISARVKVNTTDSLVNAIATAIVTYQTKVWTWNEGTPSEPQPRAYHLFDLNRDNYIDGYPAVSASETHDGGFPAAVIASGYTGFICMAQPQIKKSLISQQGIPLDAWRRPLRIAFASKVYGNFNFGVWSAGLDGIDGTDDDLTSWGNVPPGKGTAP
jgi:hypothetical protein